MYAVISTGGKQYRVSPGDTIEIERLGADDGADVALRPVMINDDGKVRATPSQIGDAKVMVRVVGDAKGPKIDGFVYKSKSNNRRRFGHRQKYTLVEIVSIDGKSAPKKAASVAKAPAPEKASAKKAAPAKATAVKKTTAAKKTTAKKAPAVKKPAKKATPKKDQG